MKYQTLSWHLLLVVHTFSLFVCVFDTVLQYEMKIGEVFCNDSLTVLSLFSHKS